MSKCRRVTNVLLIEVFISWHLKIKQESSDSLPRTRHHENNQSESPSPIDVIEEVDNIFKPTSVTYE